MPLKIFKRVGQYFANANAQFIRYNNSSERNTTRGVKILRKLVREMRFATKKSVHVIENEIPLSGICNFPCIRMQLLVLRFTPSLWFCIFFLTDLS